MVFAGEPTSLAHDNIYGFVLQATESMILKCCTVFGCNDSGNGGGNFEIKNLLITKINPNYVPSQVSEKHELLQKSIKKKATRS